MTESPDDASPPGDESATAGRTGLPPEVETDPVAGVPVPTTCRDRVDGAALRAAVDALEAHAVGTFWVSPSGGLKCRIGVRRPERVQQSLREALADAGYGVVDHGVRRGFRRLRVDLVG